MIEWLTRLPQILVTLKMRALCLDTKKNMIFYNKFQEIID